MGKLSQFENFNGKHSREKCTVILLLYRAYENSDTRGLPQQCLSSRTGVNPDTINSAIGKWREWGLLKRNGYCVLNKQPRFLYSIGKEGIEWIEDVIAKRPDVIRDCQARIDKQMYIPDTETVSIKEAFAFDY